MKRYDIYFPTKPKNQFEFEVESGKTEIEAMRIMAEQYQEAAIKCMRLAQLINEEPSVKIKTFLNLIFITVPNKPSKKLKTKIEKLISGGIIYQ